MARLKTPLLISTLMFYLIFYQMGCNTGADSSGMLTMDSVVDSISRQGLKLIESDKTNIYIKETKVKSYREFEIDGKQHEDLYIYVLKSEKECNNALNEFREYYRKWQMRRTLVLKSKNVLILSQPYELYISEKGHESLEKIEKAMNVKFKDPLDE